MMSEKYWARVGKRNPGSVVQPSDRSFRCLCCRDSGILPTDIVNRYLEQLQPDLWEEYQEMGFNAPAIACNRNGCVGGSVEVGLGQSTNPDDYNAPSTRRVPRYAEWAIDNSLGPDACRWIHDTEAAALVEGDVVSPAQVAQMIGGLVQSRSIDKAIAMTAEPEPTPPALPDEVDGYRVGDRITITLANFDQRTQKEMRKLNECPMEGEPGTVQGFEKSSISNRVMLVVQFDSGEIESFPSGYLAHLNRDGLAA